MEITLTMHFHALREERPMRSGQMIVLTKYKQLTTHTYSFVNQSFGCYDSQERPSEEDIADWDDYIVYWAYGEPVQERLVYEV